MNEPTFKDSREGMQIPSPPAPQGGASMNAKPTQVKVLQALFYFFGVLTVLGSLFLFNGVGGRVSFQGVTSMMIGAGMIAVGYGMGKRMKWAWTLAVVILGINLLYSFWPKFNVVALVFSLVLLYFTWQVKEYFNSKP